jgi:5'(3')-deoxyribonucleotidase
MRLSRLRDICNRTPYYNITKDTLMLLKDMCIKDIDKAIPTLIEYNIQPQDMDIINHLAILTKIKPRALQNVKKKLKQHYEEVLRCP